MKKLIIAGIFIILLSINTYNALNIKKCENVIRPTALNSKNLLEYLENNNLNGKITKICSTYTCKNLSGASLERDVKEFINSYYNFLKQKNEDAYNEATLKGFRIDKIVVNNCY